MPTFDPHSNLNLNLILTLTLKKPGNIVRTDQNILTS